VGDHPPTGYPDRSAEDGCLSSAPGHPFLPQTELRCLGAGLLTVVALFHHGGLTGVLCAVPGRRAVGLEDTVILGTFQAWRGDADTAEAGV
jgi:hypothetical protein